MTLRMDQSSQGATLNDEKQILDDFMSVKYCLLVGTITLTLFTDPKRRSV